MVASPTAETKALILAAAQTGVDLNTLADYAGVSKTTMRSWLDIYHRAQRLIENEEPVTDQEIELYELFQQCIKLRAQLEVGLLGVIISSAHKGHARSAIWLTETIYDDKYGKDGKRAEIEEAVPETAHASKYASVAAAMKAVEAEHEQFALSASQDDIVDAEIVEE